MAEVIGIDHIYITVSDLVTSERFYDRVLGVVLGFRKNEFVLGGDRHIQHFNRHYPETSSNTFREKALLRRAAENTCYVASVNCASAGSPTTSVLVRPNGTVLDYQPYGGDGLLVVDINLAAATGLLALRLRE
jgi:catechol 2,3-dioxygenase-like lactoylglutathione lyase family enzyme